MGRKGFPSNSDWCRFIYAVVTNADTLKGGKLFQNLIVSMAWYWIKVCGSYKVLENHRIEMEIPE